MARQDPLRKFRFRLEIDGIEQAATQPAIPSNICRATNRPRPVSSVV